MPRRALIIVGGHRTNGLLYVQAARRLGLHPIALASDPTQYDYLAAESIEAIRVDTNNLNALMDVCSRLRATYDICGIIGFGGLYEWRHVTVAKLCRHFALPGANPVSIERCSDKYTQRQFLAQAGVPVPAYRLAANAMEIESSAAKLGWPVILKPSEGSGSSGVRLCRDANELAEHTTYLLGGKYPWRSSPKILVEEFAQGSFYDVVTMGNSVVAIGAADFDRPPHFVPCQSMFPAPLTEEEHKRIVDVSLSCLRALNLGWGPANIELRWTERGPVVIEVNARLPGWTTPRLVQLAYGVDIINEHINLVIGNACDLRTRHSHVAIARFLVPDRNGILAPIDGISRAAAVPGVEEVRFYVEPGTPIIRKGDHLDMIGHVIAASPERTRAEAILHSAIDLIGWSIIQLDAM
ncbi:acetyl-CoA carboxylase biotin carboxylase subunit family protein [Mesorhizobium sp.]|uniref:ATP-grasp domain-containing protein n=1 Tax=Mesorhizobium sp. TaxID=1871066 RepID=UPI000FE5528B|nr:acetyl-CoA carboxylase biotin carboxylase subunit family protein [Mesorhizobium sp.]TGQ63427.1 ATP-grasp domain-containing protein [bacterium M00.F.Ca.ET.205.01.1.1]TGU46612.1 ATP-grasp domain-containing protein [bacterium M00.F.Ca.ET.152.01.1.1]TGV31700.1 ATP-grasp domain-containing protein [Mesorhizobium sp. M00.F.Ca.ET.186.01.1.1]TGZ38883.1 ATP-grasp domain-containing protein [bacterium M00.F.Ca.ET.162.01.1.1]RWA60760.1 MAG: ATP-grasp domain-containing protein [Mesorhizobium sp.]